MDDGILKPYHVMLRDFRTDKGITRQVLSIRSGIAESTITAHELGKRQPRRRDTVEKLATGLRLSTEECEDLFRAAENAVGDFDHQKRVGSVQELENSSDATVRRHYLERLIHEYSLSELIGLAPSKDLYYVPVPLCDVFIPVEFHSSRPLETYVPTETQMEEYLDALASGDYNENIENYIFEVERLREGLSHTDRISFADLWYKLDNDSAPHVAVIQGYPGTGKSTLAARLALYMAHCGLGQRDLFAEGKITALYTPIVLSLGAYAREWKAQRKSSEYTIWEFIQHMIVKLKIAAPDDTVSFLGQELKKGHCLIMLDGLDEISINDKTLGKKIYKSIREFINDYEDNRVLITTRVAGYEQKTFPYTHYQIADLTQDQIEAFLPRWSRANVLRNRSRSETTSAVEDGLVLYRAEQLALDISDAISKSVGVRLLAENPFLLTLMAILRQNGFRLPERRVELYDLVASTLLKYRNLDRELSHIDVDQAIAYLSPIAYRMHVEKNSIILKREVTAELQEIILADEDGDHQDVLKEIEGFLIHLHIRGGIFVVRAGEFYGFFHRTFQEYFVARHILAKMEDDEEHEIAQLVEQVRIAVRLWREPFLLTVAYASIANKGRARRIIDALLKAAEHDDFTERVDALVIAAESIIESKPLDKPLKESIAQELLLSYQEAQRTEKFSTCHKIEEVMRYWLSSLNSRPLFTGAPLATIERAIIDNTHPDLQFATLTLLSLIAQGLERCLAPIFNRLVPSLLAIAGLPSIGSFHPVTATSAATDLTIADLALTILSFFGAKGPPGVALELVREHFVAYPEHLRALARYSLENAMLLTPTVIPQADQNYQRYESAIAMWIVLRDQIASRQPTEDDITQCIHIHQMLLDCADEACYPAVTHLMEMLQAAVESPNPSWQIVWQNYLLHQLSGDNYMAYQEAALLWAIIFPSLQMQELVLSHVLKDLDSSGNAQRYAQHIVALLANDVTEPRDLRLLSEVRYFKYLRDLSYRKYIRDFGYMPNKRNLVYLRYLRRLHTMEPLGFLSLMRYQRYFRYRLLTQENSRKAVMKLVTADASDARDLLTIIIGRILQAKERCKMNDTSDCDEIAALIPTITASLPEDEICLSLVDNLRDILRRAPESVETATRTSSINKQAMVRYFTRLGGEMKTIDHPIDIILLNKAAMMARIDTPTKIGRIDTYFWTDYKALSEAVLAVARTEELPERWISSALAAFTYIFKKEPTYQIWREFSKVHVYMAELEYILAMKLMSGRAIDDNDINLLIRKQKYFEFRRVNNHPQKICATGISYTGSFRRDRCSIHFVRNGQEV